MRTAGFLTTSDTDALVNALRNLYTPDQLAALHEDLTHQLDAAAPVDDPLGKLLDALFLGAHRPTPPETKETRSMQQQQLSPVVALRDGYEPLDYNPDAYIDGAAAFLAGFGVLARPIDDFDRDIAKLVLAGLDALDLDVTDVYPFGVVWALRSTGALDGSPQLDAALTDWRKWEETDHVGEPLSFLPALPGAGTPAADGS